MDRAKLNTVYNLLKEMVGEQGAFILFTVDGKGVAGEDLQVRSYGPISRQQGLLSVGGQFYQGQMEQRIEKAMEVLPQEPD